jgi:hypothetical protein
MAADFLDFANHSRVGINTTAWTSGSSLLSLGLSVPQAMGVVVGASLISSIIAVITGWMGSHHYLGFTVLSRGYMKASNDVYHVQKLTVKQILGNPRWFLARVEQNHDGLYLGMLLNFLYLD